MHEGSETARAPIVVLEQETVEEGLLEYARDRLIVAFGVELALVVAAAHMESEGDSRIALDDRVVELDAAVDQLLGVAPALPVALAHGRVEKRPILRRVDLDVCAPEADELVDLAPGQVDDVGEVVVAGRIGGPGLFGVVIGGGLLRAEHRHLARPSRSRAQDSPLLAAHASLPPQPVDDDRALEDELLAFLVPERNRPAALTVESLERLDEVTVEGVAAQLPVRHHIDPGLLLQLDGGPDRRVLDRLELRLGHLACLQPVSGVDQVSRPKETADDLRSPPSRWCRHPAHFSASTRVATANAVLAAGTPQ